MRVPLLNFEGGPGVLLLNFEAGPWVPLLKFEGGPGSRVPGSRGSVPTFTPCLPSSEGSVSQNIQNSIYR